MLQLEDKLLLWFGELDVLLSPPVAGGLLHQAVDGLAEGRLNEF